MKLFISSDIEGTAGIANWEETRGTRDRNWYSYFQRQMSREAAAACEGALAGGCKDVLVKDAHGTGRNILPDMLPLKARLSRDWAGHPYSMVAGLDDSYDALAFTGYHSAAHSNGNPLSHTMTGDVDQVTINGVRTSEFLIHVYIAGMLHIPVVFLSGDEALCEHAKFIVPGIKTVATLEGDGDATTSIHPDLAVQRIREGMQDAISRKDFSDCMVPMPGTFDVTVRYLEHTFARKKSFYPGAEALDEKTIGFSSNDYWDVLRFFHFVI